jgi:sulfatase modifying factor 1
MGGVLCEPVLRGLLCAGVFRRREGSEYKAAYHKNDGDTGNYFTYPTSNNTAPGRDLDDASGNNANYYGSPYPIQSPYYTTLAGEFQNSGSPYDTFDQGGNVWEWNEAVLYGSYRGLRGGSFDGDGFNLQAGDRYSYCWIIPSESAGTGDGA